MKTLLSVTMIILSPAFATLGAESMTLGEELKVPIPEGWILATDSVEFPFQLLRVDPVAELLIFKSTISAEDAIRNNEDLKLSVKKVIDDVIMDINGARLLTSTGFNEGYRTGFLLDFLSEDTVNNLEIRNRFRGIIYRHPDGHQLLYTLWGKVPRSDFDAVVSDFNQMQRGAQYTGQFMGNVYASTDRAYYYLAAVVIILAGLLWIFRRRMRTAQQWTQQRERYHGQEHVSEDFKGSGQHHG
jgi:hypothetical protein